MRPLYATFCVIGLAAPAFGDDASDAMSAFLDQNVVHWASDPILIGAIRAQNERHASLGQADIDAMDQAWRAEVGQSTTPTISSVLETPASDFLREQVASATGAITEVFVMDVHGLNVAASATTSDYWQGDEAKFTETFSVGPTARHFGEIEKDESTGSYQGQASFVITDPETGDVIGAMTVGINADSLF